MTYFDRAVLRNIARAANRKVPWADVTVDSIGGTPALKLTPRPGVSILVVPAGPEFMLHAYSVSSNGALTTMSPPEGERIGLPTTADPDFAGDRIAEIANFARHEPVFVSYAQFRQRLATEEFRRDLNLTPQDAVALLADEAATQRYYQAWTADGQPSLRLKQLMEAPVSNKPNWFAWAGLLTIAATFLAFGSGRWPIPLIGSFFALIAAALGVVGVMRADRFGGRGYLMGGAAVVGALAFFGWTVYALVSLN